MNIIDQFKTGEFTNPARPLGALLYALVFALVAWLLGRALHSAVKRILARDKHAYVDRTSINFLEQLARIGIYLFASVSYSHLIPALSFFRAASLASVGLLSVVVGLAAQNTLGNLIAGISLVLYRPFKVGDRLQVTAPTGLETGFVESLNLGYTVLKTDDNRRVVVPNSAIASQTTVNLSGEDPRAICSVPIAIRYDADVNAARAMLLELARQHPKVKEVCGCPVTQWASTGIVLTLTAWCPDSGAAADLKNDLLEQARKRFAQAGIELPFPQMVVTTTPAESAKAPQKPPSPAASQS
jgi:small-conductance mechanosensitive channel